MNLLLGEILIVFLLIILNGFFSGSEIALISLRKSRVSALRKEQSGRAKIVEELQRTPENLFATTQIGVSVITIFASAFAGANFEAKLVPFFEGLHVTFLANHAHIISFALIVILVTYISLIFGELIPKSLGIRYSEVFALWAAYPIWALSKIFSPIIKIVTWSSNIILSPFHDTTSFAESKLSEEEIRTLIDESRKAGTIEPRQQEMLENVFEFADLSVDKIMTPRAHIFALNIQDSTDINVRRAIESGYSRVPFYQNTLDNILGTLHIKELLPYFGGNLNELSLQKLLLPVFFVPNSQKISDLLQQFKKEKSHSAIVTNEHGEVEGLVTLEDILEEIVGHIPDEGDEVRKDIVKEKDGSFTVSGEIPILDFNRYFKSDIPEDEPYNALSGFIMDHLERFAEQGETISYDDLELTVKEKTSRTIKEVIVKRKQTP